jgi:Tfp pilus assembly protein FimT
MRTRISTTTGISLVELLVGIAIISGISTMAFYSLPAYREKQALDNADTEVVSLLQDARTKTISGEGAQAYGVHIESDKAVLFASAYSSSAGISTVNFDAGLTVKTISLSTGGGDILFRRGTGETSSYGTLILSNSSGSRTRTISIAPSGLVSD